MCEKKRHFLWTIGIFACLLLSSFSYAGKVETIVVDSGYVVAYGKYIPPPYKITLKQGPIIDSFPFDTIFINDIAVSPHIKSERELTVISAQNAVKESVKEIIAKYGLMGAKSHIENYLESFSKGDSVVDEWKIMFSETRKNYTIVLYDDNKESIVVAYPPFREGFIPPLDAYKVPKKTPREYTIDEWKYYAERLKKGEVLVFGPPYRPFPMDGITWLWKIKSILEKEIPDSTKRELLKKLGILKRNSEEFIKNKDGWRNLK